MLCDLSLCPYCTSGIRMGGMKVEETTRGPLGDRHLRNHLPWFFSFLPTTHPLQQTYGLPMTHEGEGPDPNTGHVPEQAKLDFTNALHGIGPKASQHKDFLRWARASFLWYFYICQRWTLCSEAANTTGVNNFNYVCFAQWNIKSHTGHVFFF